ncbi:MAG: hypothetical protein U0166_07465 [Acidobacteriota bacterium]
MRNAARVAREIELVEGFRVRISHLDGTDASGDSRSLMPYRYPAPAPGSMTVAAWHEARFVPVYPGLICHPIDAGGADAPPSATLASLRERLA